ncbi:poly(A) RNA polymerase, mitochondrial-like [Lycorma delicatula]|uniref:poly(A) RNA polymerase, mitochondrial-like n=1 Tax=Lycorma delicatula TaxID=130591 RepID=UPI003F51A245
MFVLLRSCFNFRIVPYSKYNKNVSGNLFKSFLLGKKKSIQHSCRSTHSEKVELNVNNNVASKKYIQFEKMLEMRRLQAKRSILVQVHSEQSCVQLHEYCSQFGLINKMMHYTMQPNLHFVIVEFNDENSAHAVVFKSNHMDNSQIVPVRSQFLWFKANGNEKKKKKDAHINLEHIPLSQFGNVKSPSFEELSSLLLSCNDISDQMLMLFNAMHLDDLGTRMRFITALQIENTLSGLFPFINAIPFGSTVNSFGKLGCDLDVVLRLEFQPQEVIPNSRLIFQTKTSLVNNRTQQQRYIESVGDLIERYVPGCSNVRRILMARVPILKFKQEYTGIECDLSLTNMTGVYMSELLHIFGSIDDRVRPLVYTVRCWAQTVNLTNPTPGRWITNFSLTLLTLFYLQTVNVIPTLDHLIKLSRPEDKRFAEDVNCTFLRDIDSLLDNPLINKSSLADLLKGFFDFYVKFDFDSHALSLKLGKALPKQEHSALYIVNPLESHLNVSKNVSPEELGRLRIEICNAARYLDRELQIEHINVDSQEDWGLITLFQSQHFKSKSKDIFYSSVQKKQVSANRLVAVSDLFSEESNDDVIVDSKNMEESDSLYHQGKLPRKTTTRKR